MKKIRKKFYIPVICMLSSFFSLMSSHPQWWVIAVSFLCMAVADMQDTKFAMMLYAGISGGYILDTCLNYKGAIDNMMIKYGVLPHIIGGKSGNLSIADIYDRFNLSIILLTTFFRACILMSCGISVMKRNNEWKEQKIYI